MTSSIIRRLLHEYEEQREGEAHTLYNNFARPDRQLQQATSAINPMPVASYQSYDSALTRSYQMNQAPMWVARNGRGW